MRRPHRPRHSRAARRNLFPRFPTRCPRQATGLAAKNLMDVSLVTAPFGTLLPAGGGSGAGRPGRGQIGSASGRESVCQYVSISVADLALKKKTCIWLTTALL